MNFYLQLFKSVEEREQFVTEFKKNFPQVHIEIINQMGSKESMAEVAGIYINLMNPTE